MAAAAAMLATEFRASRDDLEDIVQQAIEDCLATFESPDAFAALVVKRARGLALDGRRRARREVVSDAPEQGGQQAFVSGKRPRPRSKLNRDQLDQLGRFFDRESESPLARRSIAERSPLPKAR